MTVSHRIAAIADMPFIVATWSRAYKRSRQAGIIATDDWHSVMHRTIERLLARRTVSAIVACDATDPEFAYGWIAGDTSPRAPVVHFAYVKESYRRAGIGRGLLAALGIDPRKFFYFTCWTPILLELGARVPKPIPLAKHDPNFARYATYTPEERPWKR